LSVSEGAAAQLTCPVCLAAVRNPLAGGVTPLAALPVAEREAGRDSQAVAIVLMIAVALLGIGAFFMATWAGTSNAIFHILIVAVVAGIVVSSKIALKRGWPRAASPTLQEAQELWQRPQGSTPLPPPPPLNPPLPPPLPGQPGTIDYRYGWAGAKPPPTSVGATIGGFFAAVGVCALGFLILLGTLDKAKYHHGEILLGIVLMVLAFAFVTPNLSRRPGWRGYGMGVTIGLTLGLLALGPCAFCYTLTIQ
jgi:hypothetical protein